MREIKWLEPARDNFLWLIEQTAERDLASAGALLENTAEKVAELAENADLYPPAPSAPDLQEIIVSPACHLLYDMTDLMVVIVAVVPSRHAWEAARMQSLS